MKTIAINNGWLYWDEHFLPLSLAEELFDCYRKEFNWQNGEIMLFGKKHQIPRMQVYFGDEGKYYRYSGKTLPIEKWHPSLYKLKENIEEKLSIKFNACLANLYRNGMDSNGWHADNEKELGENPIVASLSLGETRKFQLKHITTNERLNFQLTNGSLLVMGGELQHYWKHQVPKQKLIRNERINLTFRNII